MSLLFDPVMDALRAWGVPGYVVGGAVRDVLLGRPVHDLDLVIIAANTSELCARLARSTGASMVTLDRERAQFRLVSPGSATPWVDVSPLEGEIEQNLRARDFTVGAMAVALADWPRGAAGPGLNSSGEQAAAVARRVIDPAGGMADLKRRVLRAVSEANLRADPVRLIRAARIANQLRFRLEPDTRVWIRRWSHELAAVTPERLREEVFAIFDSRSSETGVRLMDALGLLGAVFPELDAARGVAQPRQHHYWDVFEHLLHTVGKVDLLLDRAAREQDPVIRLAPWRPELAGYFDEVLADGRPRAVFLKIAALLHDVAKPQTKSVDTSGRVRFLGHEEEGAVVAGRTMTRLRCSGKAADHVALLVRHHLRPSLMLPGGPTRKPTERAIFRYWRDLDGAGADILFLAAADYLAARGPEVVMASWAEFAGTLGAILAGGFVSPPATKPFLLLNGDEIIREFGLKPGPLVGQVLAGLREAEALGQVQTRDQAVELVKGLLAGRREGAGG